MKKHTIEDVIRYCNENGYEVLDKEYVDMHTHMNFKCKKCGHVVSKTYDGFKLHHNCPNCNKIKVYKYNLKDAEKFCNSNNFKLINSIWDKGVKSWVKLECIECGHIFNRVFLNFKENPTCPKCRENPRQLSYKDVKNFVEIESDSGCNFLCTEEEYKIKRLEQPKMPLCNFKFKCRCGNEFETNLNNFRSGNKRQCNKCTFERIGNRIKFTYNDVKQYIEADSCSGCKLISTEYKGNHEPLEIQCSCGTIFIRALAEFKGRQLFKCYKCSGNGKPWSYEDIKDLLESHNIKLLSGNYINNRQKLHIICNNGHESHRDITNIIKSNFTCPYCNRPGYGRNTESLYEEIKYITNNEYELKSEYKTMNDYVLIKHNECGYEWNVTPHNFIDAETRCPICNQSKGELRIKEIFDNKNMFYERQYMFNDLLGDYTNLKFDFAVFKDEEKTQLKHLIEYDGEFHYLPLRGEDELNKQQRYDGYKNEYCVANNIKLIRIPYWEFENIEEILNKEV